MSITHMWQLREKWQGSESSPVSSTETCRTLRLSLRVLCCRSVSCLDKDNMCFPCLKTPLQDLMVPCKHEIQTLLIISSKSQQIRFSLWMLTSIISAKNKFYCSGIPKTATQNLQSQNKGLEHENSIPFFFSIKWLNLDIRSLCLKKKCNCLSWGACLHRASVCTFPHYSLPPPTASPTPREFQKHVWIDAKVSNVMTLWKVPE